MSFAAFKPATACCGPRSSLQELMGMIEKFRRCSWLRNKASYGRPLNMANDLEHVSCMPLDDWQY